MFKLNKQNVQFYIHLNLALLIVNGLLGYFNWEIYWYRMLVILVILILAINILMLFDLKKAYEIEDELQKLADRIKDD